MASHALTGLDTALTLDPELAARLEKLARAAGRSMSDVAASVLRDFIDENDRRLAAIDAGIAEADAGELTAFDDVKADVERKLAALAKR